MIATEPATNEQVAKLFAFPDGRSEWPTPDRAPSIAMSHRTPTSRLTTAFVLILVYALSLFPVQQLLAKSSLSPPDEATTASLPTEEGGTARLMLERCNPATDQRNHDNPNCNTVELGCTSCSCCAFPLLALPPAERGSIGWEVSASYSSESRAIPPESRPPRIAGRG